MNRKIRLLAALPVAAVMSLVSCNQTSSVPTINFWTGFGTSMTTVLESYLSDYQTAHEGELELVHTGQGGYDNLLATIVGSVSTRTYPQMAVAYPDHMAQYNESSILFDMTDMLDQAGIDLSLYYPNYLQENLEIVEGRVMGLPFNKSTEVMTTNQTFVETLIKMTANATGADKITKVPTTWQEMETFGLATRKVLESTNAFNHVIGSDGVVYDSTVAAADAGVDVAIDLTNVGPNDFRVVSYDSQANFFITMVRQWGGTYTSVETLPNGKTQGYMRYKSSETVEMLKFFNRLFRENIMGIPATFGESSYTSTPFKAYKTVFTIGSSAGVSNCYQDNFSTVEINPIPYNAQNPDCKFVISQGTNLVMFRNSDEVNRQETFDLLTTLSYDPETNGGFAKDSGYIPVTTAAYESEVYQNYLNDTSLTGTSEVMRDAVLVNFDDYNGEGSDWQQFVDPGFVGSSSIRSNISGLMARCGDATEEEAASDDYWYSVLDEFYNLNPNNIPNN